MNPLDARAEAARVVDAVARGRSLDDVLPARERFADPRDAALVRALASAVLRDRRALNALIRRLAERPPHRLVHALLAVGLVQIRDMRMPEHAAVSTTVDATTALGQAKARGFLNAVLRRYLRERAQLDTDLPVRWLPDWLDQAIRADWGDAADAVIDACRTPGPMGLRVNRRLATRQSVADTLTAAGHGVRAVDDAADALVLDAPVAIDALYGFADGAVSVQDVAAQRAVDVLAPRDGERILDACAAPGGKTAHLLERADADVLALDIAAERLTPVVETLRRLGLTAATAVADATRVADWWDGTPFDAVLIDAPCSGTGVIRRHPDIPWLRRVDDIPRLAHAQTALLDALWPTIRPGGRLVYATCSILTAENAAVVDAWAASQPDAMAVSPGDWGQPAGSGRRIAPGGDQDGFFYARFDKAGSRG